MIEAAERLFAERGMQSVSLREIGSAAGQRNNSAAQYHFGSRQGLLEAIFAHRMTGINARRLALLDRLDREGAGDDLRSLVEAAILPLAETIGDAEHPTYYVRFLSQVVFNAGFTLAGTSAASLTEGFARVLAGFNRAMADMPRPVVLERVQLVNRFIVGALSELERATAAGEVAGTWRQVLVTDLVDLGVALVSAPVSEATRERASGAAVRHPTRPPTRPDPPVVPTGDRGGDGRRPAPETPTGSRSRPARSHPTRASSPRRGGRPEASARSGLSGVTSTSGMVPAAAGAAGSLLRFSTNRGVSTWP